MITESVRGTEAAALFLLCSSRFSMVDALAAGELCIIGRHRSGGGGAHLREKSMIVTRLR